MALRVRPSASRASSILLCPPSHQVKLHLFLLLKTIHASCLSMCTLTVAGVQLAGTHVSRHPLTGTFCRHCAPLHVCACRLPVRLWHLLNITQTLLRAHLCNFAAGGAVLTAQRLRVFVRRRRMRAPARLASGVPAHLLQRTSGCDLAAAAPAYCVGGLSSRGVGIACNSGACFSTRTQPEHGLLAVKC